MFEKTVALVSVKDEFNSKPDCDINFNYLDNKLDRIKFNVHKTIEIPLDEDCLQLQLENLLKSHDYVAIMGFLEQPQHLFEVISRIFHQELAISKRLEEKCKNLNIKIPLNGKILESHSCNNDCFLIYVQGLFLIPHVLCEKMCSQIFFEFLNQRNAPHIYKRILYFKKNNGFLNTDITLNENVSYHIETVQDRVKLILSSANLSLLLKVENETRNRFSTTFQCSEEGTICPDIVYNPFNYQHIEISFKYIEECVLKYGSDIFLSFNGGKDCTVLLHLVLVVLKAKFPTYSTKLLSLYVQLPNPFEELDEFIVQCQQYYDLDIVKITKPVKEALRIMLENKPNLRACLMGVRRTDPFAESLNVFQMTDPSWPQIMRVNPILDWHYSEVWDYLLDLKVPYCKLYDMGYTSLGGTDNTIKNPELKYENAVSSCETYLPAYKLFDANKERSGRMTKY